MAYSNITLCKRHNIIYLYMILYAEYAIPLYDIISYAYIIYLYLISYGETLDSYSYIIVRI